MDNWISIEDRLPVDKEVVFAYHVDYGIGLGIYPCGQSKVWHFQPFKEDWKVPSPGSITHWLPIPELPKPEQSEPMPPPVFEVKHSSEASQLKPWGLYHVTGGCICNIANGWQARVICDRLNALWQLEKELKAKGKCKNCRHWTHSGKGHNRFCYHLARKTKDTESCDGFGWE